jgi:hypothetical protein
VLTTALFAVVIVEIRPRTGTRTTRSYHRRSWRPPPLLATRTCRGTAAAVVKSTRVSTAKSPLPWCVTMPTAEGDAVDCRPLSSSGNAGGGDKTSAANRPRADGASSFLPLRSRDAAMAASCRCCGSEAPWSRTQASAVVGSTCDETRPATRRYCTHVEAGAVHGTNTRMHHAY